MGVEDNDKGEHHSKVPFHSNLFQFKSLHKIHLHSCLARTNIATFPIYVYTTFFKYIRICWSWIFKDAQAASEIPGGEMNPRALNYFLNLVLQHLIIKIVILISFSLFLISFSRNTLFVEMCFLTLFSTSLANMLLR